MNWFIELQLKNPEPVMLARCFAMLGNKEEALIWLEKAMEERSKDVYQVFSYYDFKDLHSDPRFKVIVKKLGLTDFVKKE